MRQGEIQGLHREDINLEKSVINVRYQINVIRGQGLTISEPETDMAHQPVTIPESALKVLISHLTLIAKLF